MHYVDHLIDIVSSPPERCHRLNCCWYWHIHLDGAGLPFLLFCLLLAPQPPFHPSPSPQICRTCFTLCCASNGINIMISLFFSACAKLHILLPANLSLVDLISPYEHFFLSLPHLKLHIHFSNEVMQVVTMAITLQFYYSHAVLSD